MQNRLITALHKSGGTLLFSTANLYEFAAMTDLGQAASTEAFLLKVMPALHVADTALDKGYLMLEGAPIAEDAPDQHWLLKDLGERARIAGGHWNTHRFIQDAIIHRDTLLPLFEDLKAQISNAVAANLSSQASVNARKFVPRVGMTLREALMNELMREPHVNPAYTFDGNDAMDFLHTAPAAVVGDFILLDARWCHRLESAAKRIKKGGITGKLARPFSHRTVPEFLTALETYRQ